MHLYNFPSTNKDNIEINDHIIISKFKSIRNHYSCIAGYDYENGSFRGKNYKNSIKLISGYDMEKKIEHHEIMDIYNKIRKLNAVCQNSLQYYHQKYPFNQHHFPIELDKHYQINNVENKNDSYISSCELDFLQILFEIYVEHKMTLIPTYKEDWEGWGKAKCISFFLQKIEK